MKILYITPQINGEGGIQKILSVKTNYFIENFDYQIDILTQDKGNCNLFFAFNSKINLYDMVLSTNKIVKFFQYRKAILNQIKASNPDCIMVCDAGIKAFLLPLILNQKKPLFFEMHGSKYNESQYFKQSFYNRFFRQIKYFYKGFFIKFYDKIILLSPESLAEWKIKNAVIIPNAISEKTLETSNLLNKKVIVVARHSYEKGLDLLLKIWQKVNLKHPNWQLEIYGSGLLTHQLKSLSEDLKIKNSVVFYSPIKNISDKYLNASIYAMTSRQEGFPMVLLEAMNVGLPIIAFDCPIGPRSLVENNVNGFLIQDKNLEQFADKLCYLIANENLRIEMGKNAKKSIEKYQIDVVMKLWKKLFECTVIPHSI